MIRRKKATTEPAAEAAVPEATTTAAEAAGLAEAGQADAPAKRDRFRSWVTDGKNGYERLTDEQAQQIVVKFKNKPEPDVVAKLKEAGFRYQNEYFGQRKVWTRRNDFEGRLQVEQLEAGIRGQAQEREDLR